jgi:mono/diheme cytochrome c family protein
VFDVNCVGCHSAGNASGGLNLEAAASYAMLIDIPSNGDPNFDRVEPLLPDDSYLIQKLEGTASDGGVMPPGAPLPQTEIDVVRAWITNGAIDDTVVPPAAPVTVTSLSPMPNEVVSTPPASIVAGFSRELDQTSVGPTTFLLTASGGDGTFGEANDVPITAAAITVGANPSSATFDLGAQQLADDTYRVSLLGNATASILDLDGNMLDGEYLGGFPTGDMTEGGDFVVQFTVPITIGPTLRQIQAVVFTPKCAICHDGAGAVLPGVMNLTSEAESRAALVNVPSIQNAALDRVEPGQAANSYLVHKIDGTAASQMPPTGPLPQAEIDAIVQWINDGAP